MYMPALAAGMAVLTIMAVPTAGRTLHDAFQPASLFQPLTCAMANAGSCHEASAKASDIYLMASPENRTNDTGGNSRAGY